MVHHNGIVDEHVDRSELRFCEGNERLHVVVIGDVEASKSDGATGRLENSLSAKRSPFN
jgi:hypothetical protein